MPPDGDPGWRPALRGIWWVLVPALLRRLLYRRAAKAGLHGLTILRSIFVSLVTGLVGVGVVVGIITSTSKFMAHPLAGGPVAAAIIIFGIASLEGERRIERPLDCTDEPRLAGSYQVRFFLRVAFSEVIALVGFVAVILTNQWWPYLLGVGLTAVGFWRLAPNLANLARDQAILTQAGCERSLVAALARLPPPGSRRRGK
jgi:hypothetical protein